MPETKEAPNNPGKRGYYISLLSLICGGIVLFGLTWYGAVHFGQVLAGYYAKRQAVDWSNGAISALSQKTETFVNRGMGDDDKYMLRQYQRGTSIYHYELIAPDGEVFWSSLYSRLGASEKSKSVVGALKSGEIATTIGTEEATRFAGLRDSYEAGKMRNSPIRDVSQVIIPVRHDGKIVGAFLVRADITELSAWFNSRARQIAIFLCAAVALIFMLAGIGVASYGRERTRQAKALIKARRKAEDAEAEARGMADQLKTMNEDIVGLNKELAESLKTLRETQDEVIRKGKLAQLGQLTATVAHDIRNPLGSVRTSAFLLRRKFAEANPAMETPLKRIENGIERCNTIITSLLDFTRTKELGLENVNLDSWLVNLLREQASSLPDELNFEVQLGLNERSIQFDTDRMQRAVVNFLTNASEAMVGKGSDKPENPTANPTISVATRLSDRGVEISVSDNGPGMDEETRTRIFEPLFTTKSFGIGLGIPAVEKIFEQHGGGLEVVSEVGKGTTFTGWFPLERKTSEEKAA